MSRNRRLVPMPTRQQKKPEAVTPLVEAVTPPAQWSLLPPPLRAVPPFSWPPKSYDIWALLITVCLAAILWRFRHIIFLVCAIYFLLRFFRGLFK
jgi:hypothetical protein